jgi:hypothetical protein
VVEEVAQTFGAPSLYSAKRCLQADHLRVADVRMQQWDVGRGQASIAEVKLATHGACEHVLECRPELFVCSRTPTMEPSDDEPLKVHWGAQSKTGIRSALKASQRCLKRKGLQWRHPALQREAIDTLKLCSCHMDGKGSGHFSNMEDIKSAKVFHA